MIVTLSESRARRRFKSVLGQANHLLITLLVGAHAIESDVTIKIPQEMRAAWNPIDRKESARRARRLVLEMALARGVDALDAYFSWAHRKPSLFQDEALRISIDSADRSVFLKFRAVKKHLPCDPVLEALIDVLIAWRNRSVHLLADNEPDPQSWKTLREHAEQIEMRFKGLDVGRLFQDFDETRPPALKETASLLAAVQKYVEELEAQVLSNVDMDRYLRESISKGISCASIDSVNGEEDRIGEFKRAQRITSIWGNDGTRKSASILSLLRNYGFQVRESEAGCQNYASVDEITLLTPKEVWRLLYDRPWPEKIKKR